MSDMDIDIALKNIGDWISKETESRKYPKGELLELSESLQALKAEIASQSVTSEDVQRAIEQFTEWEMMGWSKSEVPNSHCLKTAITALQAYQPWVSVDDRLPDDWVPVLVTYIGCNDGKPYSDGVARWRVKENAYVSGWLWDLDRSEVAVKITHWKPLPEIPEGE